MADDDTTGSGIRPSILDQKLSNSNSINAVFREAVGGMRIVAKKSPDRMPGVTAQANDSVDRLTQTESDVNTSILKASPLTPTKFADKMVKGGGVDYSGLLRSSSRSFVRLEDLARRNVRNTEENKTVSTKSFTDSDRLDRIARDIRESKKLSDVMGVMSTSSTLGMLQFQRGMAASYMRKSLALSYQQVGLAKAMLSITGSTADMLEAKLEAIKLNTAAPETAKASLWDRLKAEIRGQLVKDRATKIINYTRDKFRDYIRDPAARQLYRLRSGQDFTNTLDVGKDTTARTLGRIGKGIYRMGGEQRNAGDTGFISNLFHRAGEHITSLSKRLEDAELSPDQKLSINTAARKFLSRVPGFFKKYTGADAINSTEPPKDGMGKPIAANTDFAVLGVLKDIKTILLDWPKCDCQGNPLPDLGNNPFKDKAQEQARPRAKPKVRVRADVGDEVPPSPPHEEPVPPSPGGTSSRSDRLRRARERFAERMRDMEQRRARARPDKKSDLKEKVENVKEGVKEKTKDYLNRGRAGADQAYRGARDGLNGTADIKSGKSSRIYRTVNNSVVHRFHDLIIGHKAFMDYWNSYDSQEEGTPVPPNPKTSPTPGIPPVDASTKEERIKSVGAKPDKRVNPETVSRAERIARARARMADRATTDAIRNRRDTTVPPTSTSAESTPGFASRVFDRFRRRTEKGSAPEPKSTPKPSTAVPPHQDDGASRLYFDRLRDTVLHFDQVVAARHLHHISKEHGIPLDELAKDIRNQGIAIASDDDIRKLHPSQRKHLLMQSRIFTNDVLGSKFSTTEHGDHPLWDSIKNNGGVRNILRQKYFSLSNTDPNLRSTQYSEHNLPKWPEPDPNSPWAKTRTRRFFRSIGRGTIYTARDIGRIFGPAIEALPTQVAGPGYFKGLIQDAYTRNKNKREKKVENIRENNALLGRTAERMITKPTEAIGNTVGILAKTAFKLASETNALIKRKNPKRKGDVEKRKDFEERILGRARPNSFAEYMKRLDEAHNSMLGYVLDRGIFPLIGAGARGVAAGAKGVYNAGLKASVPVSGAWGATKEVLGDMFDGTLAGLAGRGLWKLGTAPFKLGGHALKFGGAALGAGVKGFAKGADLKGAFGALRNMSKFGLIQGFGLEIPFAMLGEKMQDWGKDSKSTFWRRTLGYGGAALKYGAIGAALGGPWGAAIGAGVGLIVQRMGGFGNTISAMGHVLAQGARLVGKGFSSVFHGLVGRKAKVTRDGRVISKGHDGIIGTMMGYLFGSKTLRTKTGEVYQDGHEGVFPAIWHFFRGRSYSNGEHIDGSSTFMKGMKKLWNYVDPVGTAHASISDISSAAEQHPAKVGSAAALGKQSSPGNVAPGTRNTPNGVPNIPGRRNPGVITGGIENDPSAATFGWAKVTGQLSNYGSPYMKFLTARMQMYGVTDRSVVDYVVSLEKAQAKVFETAWGKVKSSGDKTPSFNDDDYAYMAKRFGFDPTNKDAVAYFESWYQRRFRPVCKAAMQAMEAEKLTFDGLYAVRDEQVPRLVNSMKQSLTSVLNETAGLEPDVSTYLKYKKVADADPGGRASQVMKPTKAFNPFKDNQDTDLSNQNKLPNQVKTPGMPLPQQTSSVEGLSLPKAGLNSDAVSHAAIVTGDVTDQPEYKLAFDKLPDDLKKRVKASRGLQFVLWSTAVQHGPSVAVTIFKKNYVAEEDNRTFIRKIYEDRSTKFIGQTTENRVAAMSHIGDEQNFAEDVESGKNNYTFADMRKEAGVAINPMGDATVPDLGTPTPAKQKALAKQAYDYFIKQGYTPAAAAGIIASIRQESGFDPHKPGDGGAAFGLAQWHRDRQEDIASAFGKPLQQMSFEEQLAAIDWEMRKGHDPQAREAFKKLQGIQDPNAAGQIVSRLYERPGQTDAIRTQEAIHRGANAAAMFADLQKTDKGADTPGDSSGGTAVAGASTSTGTPGGGSSSPVQTASAAASGGAPGSVVQPPSGGTVASTSDGSVPSAPAATDPTRAPAPSVQVADSQPTTSPSGVSPTLLPPQTPTSQVSVPKPTAPTPAQIAAASAPIPVPKGGHASQDTLASIKTALDQQNAILGKLLDAHIENSKNLSSYIQSAQNTSGGNTTHNAATLAPVINVTPAKNRDSSVSFAKKASIVGDTV